MADIVERLLRWSNFGYGYQASRDMKEAATEIVRLRAALHYIAWEQKEDDQPHLIARAALETPTASAAENTP